MDTMEAMDRNRMVSFRYGRDQRVVKHVNPDYYQMQSEPELLRTLAESEDDVKNGRIAPIKGSFDDLCASLLERKDG